MMLHKEPKIPGYYKVTFLVHDSNKMVTRDFDSRYKMELFLNKVRHSNKLSLVSYSH